MKILSNSNVRIRASGSALMITLITAVIFGVVIGTALTMVSTQNRAVARSQSWNNAIPVAEAGIEEALTHYYLFRSNITANGWANSSGNWYYKSRTFADGNRFTVYMSNSIAPTIVSTGWVTVPFSTNQIFRAIRITTAASATFTKAMVSMTTIDLNGNNVSVDSFDPTSTSKSTNGRYDVSKRQDKGDVASVLGILNVLDLGNSNIRGTLHTGPGGTASVGANGSVGDNAWVGSGTKGVKSGHFADDMNVSFPDVEVPFTSGYSTPTAGIINGTNYTYVLTNTPPATNYQLTAFTSGATIYVGTNSVLHVTGGNVNMGDIIINTNSILSFYHGSGNASLNQSVSVRGNTSVNSDGRAVALQYYALPSVKSVTLTGNEGYIGTIYAPQADFILDGGGSSIYDVMGAVIVRSVTLNGRFNFHYDESLKRMGPATAPIMTAWTEL